MTVEQIWFSQDSAPGIYFLQLFPKGTKKGTCSPTYEHMTENIGENFNPIKMPPITVVFK